MGQFIFLFFFAVRAITLSAAPTQAQIGCCYCDNCPVEVGPLCTDVIATSASCVDLCIVQRACSVIEFSPQETCDQGCGSKPPFFSPTPTSTPTATTTPTPTISPTPSITPTATITETPIYCCQGGAGNDRCGMPDPPNQPLCLANETPIMNASCADGLCTTFTPTVTATNTAPTRTFTMSPTQTPTKTATPTVTPTVTIGGFMLNPFSCYRITATQGSAAKNVAYTVEDVFGVREKKILKPRYICAPGNVEFDDVTGIPNADEFLACYKIKDIPKAASVSLTVRNALDEGLALQTVKGDLLCIPSYAKVPTSAPRTATPTPAAPTPAVTPTP